MSQIFDALRRTEARPNGTERDAPEAATEVLRQTERKRQAQLPGGEFDESRGHEEHVGMGLLPRLEARLAMAPSADLPAQTVEEVEGVEEEEQDEVESVDAFPLVTPTIPDASKLPCLTNQDSPTAEAFRLLTVRLRELRRSLPLQVVVITSTIPKEGKSFVAGNLALALAQGTGQKVLLLDGDVRRPTVASVFGLPSSAGLCEWLGGKKNLSESVVRLSSAELWVLTAGKAPENPLDALQSSKLPALLEILRERFDWIIVDAPPVLPLADTSLWSNLADGVLLVARQGTTRKKQLQSGLETIDSQKLIGAVVNCSTKSPHEAYYYYQSSDPS